ncbi:MAG TPA: selenocysteine-specific translation elongation factor, partial [Candidatus Latescibacteria bacterium]|nr:selenocysteine-specific translation elongation factor [Candidatus Latescibacterota bacterium]
IDHGKTLLVKALTGTDTDQAPEEKARGITIELGFAFLGESATIIDVPGHERFVKTMVAGVSTIDVAMLLIAADDGVMPQSREHLDVLELLGVERGVLVLNKVDLVEEDWLDLVEEELREFTRGTFLQDAEIFRVSALSGEGVDPLRQRLLALAGDTEDKRADAPFRLPVDRAFVVKGFGLVCTGTALVGSLGEGDRVEIMPEGREVRVRSMQQHGVAVGRVQAGDRAAINLAGVEQGQIERGDLLVAPEAFRPTQMLDVRLRLLQSSPMSIEPRTRVRLHLGTREIMARVVLPERKLLEPGEESVAQLRLEAPLVAAWGDRFVLRRYSPALTIGGGTVLDPHPAKHRRFDTDLLDHLRVLECGELPEVVERWILAVDDRLKSERDLLGELGIGPERLQEVLGELVATGMVVRVDSEGQAQLLHSSVRGRWGERIEVALADFHRSEPLKPGLRREELRNLSARYAQPELFACVLRYLVDEGRVAMDGAVVRAASHGIRFTPEEEATRTEIEKRLNTTAFTGIPDAAGLARALAVGQQQVEAILRALQELEIVVSLEGGLLAHREALVLVQDQLCAYLQADGEITVAQFRELIGSNRKYAMALLGYFDAAGVTARDGDVRVLLS